MIKQIVISLIVGGMVIIPSPAQAKTYSSCSQLQQVYKGGVAKNGKVRNIKMQKGKLVRAPQSYRPKVSASLYKSNKSLDRDGDGIACER